MKAFNRWGPAVFNSVAALFWVLMTARYLSNFAVSSWDYIAGIASLLIPIWIFRSSVKMWQAALDDPEWMNGEDRRIWFLTVVYTIAVLALFIFLRTRQ